MTQSARMLIPKIVASRLELAMGFATGLYELADHFTVLEWISAELFLEVRKLILCIYILTETLGKPGYLHQVFSRVRSEHMSYWIGDFKLRYSVHEMCGFLSIRRLR